MAPKQKPREDNLGRLQTYMVHKKDDTQEQHAAMRKALGAEGGPLAGLRIFVNGACDPPKEEIERLVIGNGGTVENYPTRDTVDVWVQDEVRPDQLERGFRANRDRVPIVPAKYVTDCVEHGRILRAADYDIVAKMSRGHGQRTLQFGAAGRAEDGGKGPPDVAQRSEAAGEAVEAATEVRGEPKATTRAADRGKAPVDAACAEEKSSVVLHVLLEDAHVVASGGRDPEVPTAVCVPEERAELWDSAALLAANASARACGVRPEQLVADALVACPALVVLDLDTRAVDALAARTRAALDACGATATLVADGEEGAVLATEGDADRVAAALRREVSAHTGCSAVVGIAASRVAARLAASRAQAGGQLRVALGATETFVGRMPLAALPGVGRAALDRLSRLGLETCAHVRACSLDTLRSELGDSEGEMLWDAAAGKDGAPPLPLPRPPPPPPALRSLVSPPRAKRKVRFDDGAGDPGQGGSGARRGARSIAEEQYGMNFEQMMEKNPHLEEDLGAEMFAFLKRTVKPSEPKASRTKAPRPSPPQRARDRPRPSPSKPARRAPAATRRESTIAIPSVSQLDFTVVDELPSQFRDRIRERVEAEAERRAKLPRQASPQRVQQPGAPEPPGATSTSHVGEPMFEREDIHELRSALEACCADGVPAEALRVAAEVHVRYAVQLVEGRELSAAAVLLRHSARLAERRERWRPHDARLATAVQHAVAERFPGQARLAVGAGL